MTRSFQVDVTETSGGFCGLILIGVILAPIAGAVLGAIWLWTASTDLLQYGTIDHSQALARASATAVARNNTTMISDAQRLIAQNDTYLAAAELAMVMASGQSETQARMVLPSLGLSVSGGVAVYDGTPGAGPPVIVNWSSGERAPLPNWPRGAELYRMSRDGRRALVGLPNDYNIGQGRHNLWMLDVATGSLARVNDFMNRTVGREAHVVSPLLDKWVTVTRDSSVISWSTTSQSGRKLCPTPTDDVSGVNWASDNETVVLFGRSRIGFANVATGRCWATDLPGWNGARMTAALNPKDGMVWIIAGNQLLRVEPGSTVPRRVADLPDVGTYSSLSVDDLAGALSQDGSALLVEYANKQYMVSTRSGAAVDLHPGRPGAFLRIAGWIDQVPAGTTSRSATVTISPAAGPRGTRFLLVVSGAGAGQPIQWTLTTPKGRRIDGQGQLNAQDQISVPLFQAGLGDESGTYSVAIRIGQNAFSAMFGVND